MTPKLKGSHPWALILCYPSDQKAPAWPGIDYFQSLISSPTANGLYAWWQQMSGGWLDLSGSAVFGWYGLSETLAQVNGLDRGSLVGKARAAAAAAGVDLSSYGHTLAGVVGYGGGGNVGADVALGIGATNGQPGWRWCANCEGLAFWDGSRPPGDCIAGGRHDHSSSGYYSLPHDIRFPNSQPGWSWCNKCEALIYKTATPAPCPGGGTHSFGGSGNYVLRANRTADNEQQHWKWCNKCQALAFFDGSRQPGLCPLGGRHDHTGSSDYSIPLAWAASMGWLGHECGHGFGLMHSFGTSRSGDLVNDRSPGAYGDWSDIMSWANTAQFAAPVFTPAGAGLSAPNLYKLGWLSEAETFTVPMPQSFPVGPIALRPVHGGPSNSNPRMARVIDATQGWLYTAEFRAPQSWDQGIRPAQVVVHAMRTLYQGGQDGWRWCKSCEGLIYAEQTACPAGGVHDGSGSADYWLSFIGGPTVSYWRWCQKCSGLNFVGSPSGIIGTCPAGGRHDNSQSGDYELFTIGVGQSNWKWCVKCQGLGFAGNSTPGVCPGGGLHDYGSSNFNYVLSTSSAAGYQNKWRWCNKCQGLYYAGLGRCVGGDVHLVTGDSYDYAPYGPMLPSSEKVVGQPNWRWCPKCYGMTYYDGSRAAGTCAAGGLHDVSAATIYYVPIDAEAQAGQRNWFVCTKCDALNYVAPSTGPGPCSAGGNHQGGWEYFVSHDTSSVPGATGFRWCRKCQVMVNGNNPCAGGGNHDTSASFHYVVRTDPASLVREQAFWRACGKCSALFMLDGSGNEKPCPAGGVHSPAGEYFLTGVTSDPFWRWCRKCELMAFWDGSRNPGPCPAGGRHDHSGSGAYAPPSFHDDAIQLVANLIAGQSWSDGAGRVTFQCTAVDATSATVQANVG